MLPSQGHLFGNLFFQLFRLQKMIVAFLINGSFS